MIGIEALGDLIGYILAFIVIVLLILLGATFYNMGSIKGVKKINSEQASDIEALKQQQGDLNSKVKEIDSDVNSLSSAQVKIYADFKKDMEGMLDRMSKESKSQMSAHESKIDAMVNRQENRMDALMNTFIAKK